MNNYNTFWRLNCIWKQVKIIISEKWKKTAYLSKWVINLSPFKPKKKSDDNNQAALMIL